MNHKIKINVFVIASIAMILDRITKYLVTTNMDIAEEIPIIPGIFSLLNVENTGAAFSSFTGQKLFLITISILCIGFILYLIQKEKFESIWSKIGLGILLGGTIGNLIDRIFYTGVIDFLSFTIFNYKFPVFNIADICITSGVAIYIIISIIKEKMKAKGEVYDKSI